MYEIFIFWTVIWIISLKLSTLIFVDAAKV